MTLTLPIIPEPIKPGTPKFPTTIPVGVAIGIETPKGTPPKAITVAEATVKQKSAKIMRVLII